MKWLADEWTKDRAKAFEPLIESNALGRAATLGVWADMNPEHRNWAGELMLENRVPTLTYPAFVVPALSHDACDLLNNWCDTQDWAENIEEDDAYRMPEIVVSEKDENYDRFLKNVLLHALGPWFMIAFGKLPDEYSSLQFTKYSPDDRAGGELHTDKDSDYTAVISLNTGEFNCAGTVLVDGLIGAQVVAPVPKGWALIFHGKNMLHKGLPVIEGERRLLTAWTRDE